MPGIDVDSYPALLAPIRLAGKSLRNRVIHASMTTELAKDRAVSDALVQYHLNRAIGGAALTVTEPLGMASHQRALNRPQVIPENLDRFRRWAEAVESRDCRLVGQIQDSGRGRHYSGRTHDALAACRTAEINCRILKQMESASAFLATKFHRAGNLDSFVSLYG